MCKRRGKHQNVHVTRYSTSVQQTNRCEKQLLFMITHTPGFNLVFFFNRAQTYSPSVCVHIRWPGHEPAPSSASTPPGWGRCQWPGSRFSCWLWGWLCQPAGGARCAGTPPYHWPRPAAVSHPDQWNSCFELDLRMKKEHRRKQLRLEFGEE